MSRPTYVYALVVDYPTDEEGNRLPPNNVDDRVQIADDEWVNRGWPANRLYLTRASAQSRVRLFERLGAAARVVRSRQVMWPQEVIIDPPPPS